MNGGILILETLRSLIWGPLFGCLGASVGLVIPLNTVLVAFGHSWRSLGDPFLATLGVARAVFSLVFLPLSVCQDESGKNTVFLTCPFLPPVRLFGSPRAFSSTSGAHFRASGSDQQSSVSAQDFFPLGG